MVTFNEMPPRTRSRNVIIPLVFLSTKKIPFHQMILSILVKDVREIELKGISWEYQKEFQKTYVYAATQYDQMSKRERSFDEEMFNAEKRRKKNKSKVYGPSIWINVMKVPLESSIKFLTLLFFLDAAEISKSSKS